MESPDSSGNGSSVVESSAVNSSNNWSFKKYNVILLGGASIVSYALRTRFLGKMLRAVEVPHGNLTTIIVRRNSLKALKESIIKLQPPIYPGVELTPDDINASVFIPPHFTELLTSDFQCRSLEEGTYILWTKMGLPIPKNGIDLRSFSKETFAMMAAQKEKDYIIRAITDSLTTPAKKTSLLQLIKEVFVKKVSSEPNEPIEPARLIEIDITEDEKRELVELLIDNTDREIVTLCSRYKDDPSRFRWHAVNILRTRKRFTGKTVPT